MDKERLIIATRILTIGAVIGIFTWCFVTLISPATIASAVTSGIVSTIATVFLVVNIKDKTTDTEKDWFILAGIMISTLSFGIAMLINQASNIVFPNHTLAGWPGALTCILTGAIITLVALSLVELAENLIKDFHKEKPQSSSLEEVRVEAINPTTVSCTTPNKEIIMEISPLTQKT